MTRLSNDMKIPVEKNHLVGQILYRSLDPPKKRRRSETFFFRQILKINPDLK